MQHDDETWAALRRAYEQEETSLSEIANRFGSSVQKITAVAKKEGWPARQRKRATKAATGKRTEALPTRGTQRAIIGRLYRAISLKLEHMETRMASGEDRSAQDEERESRALATLISNFEKITEAVAGLDKDRDASRARGVGADAERMRREIAERLERLGVGGPRGRGSRKPRS